MPDEVKEEIIFTLSIVAQMKQAGASDEEVKTFLKEWLLEEVDEGETKFDQINKYLRGFLLDWLYVGTEKKTPLYFKTFDEAYNLLFKNLKIRIDGHEYDFSFLGLMKNLVFQGAKYDASGNCTWKSYMFDDPTSTEACNATIEDFEKWCADKFEGLSWTYTRFDAIDFDSIERWFDNYKKFEGIDKVMQLAFDMLVHIRYICKGVNSSTWAAPIQMLGHQGYIFLKDFDLYTTTQNWDVQEEAVLSALPSARYWTPTEWIQYDAASRGYISYEQSRNYSQLRTQFRWPLSGGFSHSYVERRLFPFTYQYWQVLSSLADVPSGQPGHLDFDWAPVWDGVSIGVGTVEPGTSGSEFMDYLLQKDPDLISGWQIYPFVSGFANPLSGIDLSDVEEEYVTFKRPSAQGQRIEEKISLRGGWVVVDTQWIFPNFLMFLNSEVLKDYLAPEEEEIIDLTPDEEE